MAFRKNSHRKHSIYKSWLNVWSKIVCKHWNRVNIQAKHKSKLPKRLLAMCSPINNLNQLQPSSTNQLSSTNQPNSRNQRRKLRNYHKTWWWKNFLDPRFGDFVLASFMCDLVWYWCWIFLLVQTWSPYLGPIGKYPRWSLDKTPDADICQHF